jgi:sulfoxide reductase heme-binding subunit YedZ
MLKAARVLVFVISLLPFGYLVYSALTNNLGPDPADALAASTGEWTLRFLLLSLSITPLRSVLGQPRLMPYRRTFGLFALFYACVHFLVYLIFLLQLRWAEIAEDIVERPYITVGFVALLLLIALGATSTKGMMRRLGRRWKRLHQLVYLINILGLIHLTWILRTDLTEAVFYGSILVPLLMYRLVKQVLAKRQLKAKSLSRA